MGCSHSKLKKLIGLIAMKPVRFPAALTLTKWLFCYGIRHRLLGTYLNRHFSDQFTVALLA